MFKREANNIGFWLQQSAKIVDVRTQVEYVGFHIPGAIHIPYDEITQQIEAIRSWDTPVILYSTYGLRSRVAAVELRKNGISAIATTRDRLCELLAI